MIKPHVLQRVDAAQQLNTGPAPGVDSFSGAESDDWEFEELDFQSIALQFNKFGHIWYVGCDVMTPIPTTLHGRKGAGLFVQQKCHAGESAACCI